MSGWWFAVLAASATRFTNAIAPLKPLNVKVFIRASPTRVQPVPEARREASAAWSSRVSFSGIGTFQSVLGAGGRSPPNAVRVSYESSELRYPDNTKLCEPTWLAERPVPPVTYAKTGAAAPSQA